MCHDALDQREHNLTGKILKFRRSIIPTLETTKMSSKGQVVIPEGIRNKLGLKPSDKFVVIGDKGVSILKTLAVLRLEEFGGMLRHARKRAKKAGMRPSDIAKAISDVRSRD